MLAGRLPTLRTVVQVSVVVGRSRYGTRSRRLRATGIGRASCIGLRPIEPQGDRQRLVWRTGRSRRLTVVFIGVHRSAISLQPAAVSSHLAYSHDR